MGLWECAPRVGVWCVLALSAAGMNAEASTLARNLRCLDHWQPQIQSRAVGMETVDHQSDRIVTIVVAMPKGPNGRIWNLNGLKPNDSLPTRFVLTDGFLADSFVSVDLRPGSRLNACLDELQADLQSRVASGADALTVLTTFFNDYMEPQPEGAAFPWDRRIDPAMPSQYAEAAGLEPGHYPLLTNLTAPVAPLEAYLLNEHGVCMERVMFTSLLLHRMGIPHVMRAGATSSGGGHIWIELPDGRHLDPTWNLLEPANPLARKNWFHFSRTDFYRNAVYPVTVDEE